MKKFLAILVLLFPLAAVAQNSAYTNFCTSGSRNATTSGLNSSNLLLSSYTYCTVSVYATGTTTLIPLFSNATGTVLPNPFFASAVTGQYLFYGATGTVVDVTMSAGYPAPGIVTPTTLTGITLGGGGGGGIGYCSAGVCVSSGSSWLPSLGIQGTDVNVITSGVINGTGSALCTDANGGATTVGCLSGTLGGSVSPFFTPYSNATNQLVNSPDFWDSTGAATHTFVSTTKEVHETPETDYIGASGVAGSISFLQGTAPSVITNNITLVAPASVTGYNFLMPGEQAEGCLFDDGSGNGSWLLDCGSSIAPQITPPISGQYVIVYPTTAVTSTSNACTSATGFANGQSASGSVGAINCGTGSRTSSVTWTGFVLPSYVLAANVTTVYPFAVSNLVYNGIIMSPSMACDIAPPYVPGTYGVIGKPIGGPGGESTISAYNMQQVNSVTGITGAQISSVGCVLSQVGSANGANSNATLTVSAIGLIVFYTGTAPPINSSLITIPPLYYNSVNNSLNIDITWPFPGTKLLPTTVQAAIADGDVGDPTGTFYSVNDGATSTDCLDGGGSIVVLCYWNGVALSVYGGGAGSIVTINGGSTLSTANFGTTPSAGANGLNVIWQNSGANVSAEIVGDGNSAHFLNGIGTYTAPSGSSPTLETNGTNNSSQTVLNLINSSTNTAGLTLTETNTTLGTVQGEVAGTLNVGHGGTGGGTAILGLANLLGNPSAGTYSIDCTSSTDCAPTAAGGGDTITSPGATIAVGGTSTATTLDIALNHANTYTATQTFPNASLTNAELVNPATTVNGQTCTLGSTCTITASAGSITVGTTTVGSGTSNGLLYDNAGLLGNLGTANNGVLVTSSGGVPSVSTTLPTGLAMQTPTSITLTNGTGLPLSGLASGTSNTLIGYNGSGVGSDVAIGSGLSLSGGTLSASGGSSGISGLTAGFIPLAGSATTLTGNSHIDDGVTTANYLTATEPLAIALGSAVAGEGLSITYSGANGGNGIRITATAPIIQMTDNESGSGDYTGGGVELDIHNYKGSFGTTRSVRLQGTLANSFSGILAQWYTTTTTNLFMDLPSQTVLGWSSSTSGQNQIDTGISRDAAGVIDFGNGAQGDKSATLEAASFVSAGTTFTASGCSNSTLVGGATAGSFSSGTTGTCTVVITMGSSQTAPHGWSCSHNDLTTPADTIMQTATTTTTATFSGTTVSGDVINFGCIAY